MEETNLETTETTDPVVIENTYIYDFEELLQEMQLLRDDLFQMKEQQEIYYYENLNYLNESNITLNNTLSILTFLLITFLIFSGICIGYILGKRD